MPIFEIFRQTIFALWETRLRNFLTMFGIIWGIASVILLVGLGIRFGIDQRDHLRSIGTDIAICFSGKTAMPSGGYAAGRDIALTIDDAIAIQPNAPLVKNVSHELLNTVSEVSAWNAASRAVRGVWPEYQHFRARYMPPATPRRRNRTAAGRHACRSSPTVATAAAAPLLGSSAPPRSRQIPHTSVPSAIHHPKFSSSPKLPAANVYETESHACRPFAQSFCCSDSAGSAT
jgi:hypothetical protein